MLDHNGMLLAEGDLVRMTNGTIVGKIMAIEYDGRPVVKWPDTRSRIASKFLVKVEPQNVNFDHMVIIK